MLPPGRVAQIVPDSIISPTAELAVGLTIGTCAGSARPTAPDVAAGFGGWRPRLYGAGLAGATVGIVGMGDLRQSIARVLPAFGARVVYTDPRPLPPSQEQELAAPRLALGHLVSASDVIIAAVPLTPSTGARSARMCCGWHRREHSW